MGGAAAEHRRDAADEELLVPALLRLLARRGQWSVSRADGPAIPTVHAVAVPEGVHLLAPRVPEFAALCDEDLLHIRRVAAHVDEVQMLRHVVEVHPRLRHPFAL